MVLLWLKNTDEEQFLYESTVNADNDAVIADLVELWNTRLQIIRLVGEATRLKDYGPAKKPAEHGLDQIVEESGGKVEKGPHYNMDPMGKRNGNRCDPKLGAVIEKTCQDALEAISAKQVTMRVALTKELLQEKIDNIRGAVTIAYPMGLPEWDPVPLIIVDKDEVAGMSFKKILDPATATLWFAGKQFMRGRKVRDTSSSLRNEKTRVVVKLQGKGASAPARQPAISEDERKAMMAKYFKDQEERKRLTTNDEDDYLNSSWANPKAMKAELHGMSAMASRRGLQVTSGGLRM